MTGMGNADAWAGKVEFGTALVLDEFEFSCFLEAYGSAIAAAGRSVAGEGGADRACESIRGAQLTVTGVEFDYIDLDEAAFLRSSAIPELVGSAEDKEASVTDMDPGGYFDFAGKYAHNEYDVRFKPISPACGEAGRWEERSAEAVGATYVTLPKSMAPGEGGTAAGKPHELILDAFRGNLGSYLAPDFDWDAHIGSVSISRRAAETQ